MASEVCGGLTTWTAGPCEPLGVRAGRSHIEVERQVEDYRLLQPNNATLAPRTVSGPI